MRPSPSFVVIVLLHILCISSVLARKKDERPFVKAVEGETVSLTCDYGSVTNATLYAVKWYKDEKEFFRNYPKAENPVKMYPIEGFKLEFPLASPWQVVLHNVNISASGKYTCMVVDYPRYRTIYKSTIVEVTAKDEAQHQSDSSRRRSKVQIIYSASSVMGHSNFFVSVLSILFISLSCVDV